jgi:integrase/recombinase XerD
MNEKFPWAARTIQRVMKRIANKAGITKRSSHVLRHTFSILWIHKGGSTRALQGILGHDPLSTTEVYLNLAPEQILQEFQSKW